MMEDSEGNCANVFEKRLYKADDIMYNIFNWMNIGNYVVKRKLSFLMTERKR